MLDAAVLGSVQGLRPFVACRLFLSPPNLPFAHFLRQVRSKSKPCIEIILSIVPTVHLLLCLQKLQAEIFKLDISKCDIVLIQWLKSVLSHL